MLKELSENITIYNLYFIGRVFAVFIFGPILINKGIYYKDNLLIALGIILIIWDGIKIFYQLNYNKVHNI
jgi:hypothetical protein